jgi:uncharacterized protein with HEPN domain
MQLSCDMYLLDILNSIESIEEYLGENRHFKKYESSKLLRRAVAKRT